jgi:hypothetical protein
MPNVLRRGSSSAEKSGVYRPSEASSTALASSPRYSCSRSVKGGHAHRTVTRSCALQLRIIVVSGLVDALDATVGILLGVRRVRPADDLVLAGLIGQPAADPKLHGQEAGCRGGPSWGSVVTVA